jgi:hypothetical protein
VHEPHSIAGTIHRKGRRQAEAGTLAPGASPASGKGEGLRLIDAGKGTDDQDGGGLSQITQLSNDRQPVDMPGQQAIENHDVPRLIVAWCSPSRPLPQASTL